MGAIITVTVTSRIPMIIAGAVARAEAATAKAALDIQAQAQDRARVDTGFMKSAIQAQMEGPLTWRVDAGAPYSIYNEFGTTKMSAQPMMVPAVHAVTPSYVAAMRQLA